MKKLGILILMSLSLSSCIKDKMTRIKAFWYNTTTHDITILCYKNGVVLPTDTIKILPTQNYLFGESSEMGDFKGPGFSSVHAGTSNDSVVVYFDHIYRVSHYGNEPSSLSDKYYLYSSPRSIRNPNNYEFEMIRDKERVNIHRYYFTEADYEYAKE
jgi:hypothetical protein